MRALFSNQKNVSIAYNAINRIIKLSLYIDYTGLIKAFYRIIYTLFYELHPEIGCLEYFKPDLFDGSMHSISGRGYVDYRGLRVSDSQVRQKLQEIANLYGKRVWLTSGDRRGTGSSHVSC